MAMRRSPRVSSVIIFWNAERFLGEAIESVLAQTYEDWELMLVDDGSTDGSTSIARGHAERNPGRVRYLEHSGHRNLGMSASRNLGSRNGGGEFVAFLDADDVWLPHALEEQVALLDEHDDAAMVYGPLTWWFGWTGLPGDRDRDYVEELGVAADTLITPPTLLPRFLLDRAAVPSGIMVRRSVIDLVGGFEDAFRGEYEDQVFVAKVCLDLPVYASGRTWYRYRQHPGSAVAAGLGTGTTHDARLTFLAWLTAYVQGRGVSDPAVEHAIRHEVHRTRRLRRRAAARRARMAVERLFAGGGVGEGG
jgi:glycosyltransferase involved in cell wall biosynthesis